MNLDFTSIQSTNDFNNAALQVFYYQYQHVDIYRKFCDLLSKNPATVSTVNEIPFLPITAFKHHKVIANNTPVNTIFTSSGTTGTTTSKHYVANLDDYKKSFTAAFTAQYGAINNYCILALLPSYLERDGSSLVYMVDHLITHSQHPNSGFYLDDYHLLTETLKQQELKGQKTILLGVSYALLDLIEIEQFELKHTIVMETGGMKGRRKELIKEELHHILCEGFGVSQIHSEYGMTELLSQAYSTGNGLFTTPPWMKILTRDTEDALTLVNGKTGGINVIDLANSNSCAFIATQDLGTCNPDGTFTIIGRFDESDIRGCNLMVL